MYMPPRSARLPPPPPRVPISYAPIVPLPLVHGHYSVGASADGHLRSQSESSSSDSEESDSASDTSGSDDSSDDDSDGDSDDSAPSSRRSSHSDYSATEEEASDDGIAIVSSEQLHKMSASSSSSRPSWQSDNLGVLAVLIPISGLSTMLLTEVLACYNHFDCSKHYPTLSYAAVFKPEGHAFTLGMCLTAILIFATIALYHWFLRLRLLNPNTDQYTRVVSHITVSAGAVTSISLSGLAIFDMGAYHDAHIIFTVVFFIFAWVMMIAVHSTRRKMLREDTDSKYHKPLSLATCAQLGSVSGIRAALRRCRPTTIAKAYQIGSIFMTAGLTATGSFGLLFLMVNGMWPNPLGFTAVQEALLEAFAIVCQLLFMGTLSCELSMLTRVVEHHDYQELERAE